MIAWVKEEMDAYLFYFVTLEFRRKHHFGPYIFGSWSIWSLHFGSEQFDLSYFQFAINLVFIVNSLTKNAYVTNELHFWHV